jgi:hypothetical protein
MIAKKATPDDEGSGPHSLEDVIDEAPIESDVPEVSEQTKKLIAWDEPPDAAGHEVPPVEPEDETSVVEELVEQGMDEADRDRRIAAADPDLEP